MGLYFCESRQAAGNGVGCLLHYHARAARQKAQECRAFLAVGQDPIEARKVAKSSASRYTFKQCVDGLIKAKRAEWRSSKHAAQYAATLNRSCYALHDRAIAEIDTAAVLAILQPMWARTPETALRLRGRIEAVLDYATAQGWRTGENPARWRGHLAMILPRRQKLARRHFTALPYADLPAFIRELRTGSAVQARALEFLILTAARAGEVLGATWSEIDLDRQIWTVPAKRMKAGQEHRVPLAKEALAICRQMAECQNSHILFPGRAARGSLVRYPL